MVSCDRWSLNTGRLLSSQKYFVTMCSSFSMTLNFIKIQAFFKSITAVTRFKWSMGQCKRQSERKNQREKQSFNTHLSLIPTEALTRLFVFFVLFHPFCHPCEILDHMPETDIIIVMQLCKLVDTN